MIINFNNIKIQTSPNVYTPAEDTFFLEDIIRELSNTDLQGANLKAIAEMGCGSGYITILLLELFRESFLYSIDKNNFALALTLENLELNGLDRNKIQIINSDLFSEIKKLSFDLIIFNPPYLPPESSLNSLDTDDIIKISWEGGNKIIKDFLDSCQHFLNENGHVILLLSNYQVKNNSPETYINKINPSFRLKNLG